MVLPKRIGILTSGGDCPGLNAVIRSVVKCSTHKGWEVYGIPYGTDGFVDIEQGHYPPEKLRLQEHFYDMPGRLQGLDILQFLSGSILGSLNRGNPALHATEIIRGYQRLQLDALVAVAGDGSLDIISDLAQQGQWNWIAIPKTIDNDIPLTERSVGFDTAVDTVTDALYNLTFTAASHERVMVVQVMGRDAGHLALHAGIAGGADMILIPELIPRLDDQMLDQICRRIACLRQGGRMFALIVLAEGVRDPSGQRQKHIGDELADRIKDHSRYLCQTDGAEFCGMDAVDTRVMVLGHLQRSGTPSSFDRLLATAFGKKAVDLIAAEDYNRMVVWQSGQVQSYPLGQVLPLIRQRHQQGVCPSPVQPDDFLVQTARALGIYIGDGPAAGG